MISKKQLVQFGIMENTASSAQDKTHWEIANKILYKICRDYPRHDSIEVAIAKIWIIGRTYAAAIERGAEHAGDQFYETKVGPQMVVGIDSIFEPLRTIKSVADKNLSMVMEAYNLTNELLGISPARRGAPCHPNICISIFRICITCMTPVLWVKSNSLRTVSGKICRTISSAGALIQYTRGSICAVGALFARSMRHTAFD